MWVLLDVEPLGMFLDAITDVRLSYAEVDDAIDFRFSDEEQAAIAMYLMGVSPKLQAFEDEIFYSNENGFPIDVNATLGALPRFLANIAIIHGGCVGDVTIVDNDFIALRIDYGFYYTHW